MDMECMYGDRMIHKVRYECENGRRGMNIDGDVWKM